MPGGGYSADSDAMAVARTRLAEQVGKPAAQAARIAPTKIQPEQFGRIHTAHFGGYSAGTEQLGAALKGLTAELTALAEGIGAAGQTYAEAEYAAGSSVPGAGGS